MEQSQISNNPCQSNETGMMANAMPKPIAMSLQRLNLPYQHRPNRITCPKWTHNAQVAWFKLIFIAMKHDNRAAELVLANSSITIGAMALSASLPITWRKIKSIILAFAWCSHIILTVSVGKSFFASCSLIKLATFGHTSRNTLPFCINKWSLVSDSKSSLMSLPCPFCLAKSSLRFKKPNSFLMLVENSVNSLLSIISNPLALARCLFHTPQWCWRLPHRQK